MKRPILKSRPAWATIALAALLNATPAAASTAWELVETGGSVQVNMMFPGGPPFIGPIAVSDPLLVTSDSTFIAWTYQDSASIDFAFQNPTFPPGMFEAIFPWASVQMDIAAVGCQLTSSINLQAGIGTTQGGVPDPYTSPTVQFLLDNQIPAFAGVMTTDAYFTAALWGDCGRPVAVPCGFEVDKTGTGQNWEIYCGEIEFGWLIRVAHSGSVGFFWDGANLAIDPELNDTVYFETYLTPEPSSLLLAVVGVAGIAGIGFHRRRPVRGAD